MSELTDTIYQNIARNISEGSCVLFLGPAAITARQPDGSYRPLNELCANQLAKGLGLSREEEDSLTQVTSTLRIRAQRSDTMIISDVQDFYTKAEHNAELNPLLEQLADLPFKIIVNTTPDDFFARFYATAVRDYRFDFYNFRKPGADPMFSFGDDAPPLIYNLFGFYKKSESLVLTYNDQLAYVNKITGVQHERLPDSLLAAFAVPRFYLFLGFDFEDWSLRVLLDALFKNARNSIQPFAYPLKGKRETGPYAKIFFQGEFRMEFPNVDMESFVGKLLEHFKQLEGQASSDNGSILADVLVLHNEAKDDDGCTALLKHLKPLKIRTLTLKDAVGQGDVQQWIKTNLDRCQVVLPLVSADFFDNENPALPLLDELVARNNPRNRFLVMPVLWKNCAIDASPLGKLRTTRPLNRIAISGSGQDDKYFAEIADTLKKYIENLP
ncbi:MAG: SIR2 family protein [Lewinellaceae bacterium]|nr:SIR2 family protein [Lewinellaceae bacterium]